MVCIRFVYCSRYSSTNPTALTLLSIFSNNSNKHSAVPWALRFQQGSLGIVIWQGVFARAFLPGRSSQGVFAKAFLRVILKNN